MSKGKYFIWYYQFPLPMPHLYNKFSCTRNLKQVKASEGPIEDDIMDNIDSTINTEEIIPKIG